MKSEQADRNKEKIRHRCSVEKQLNLRREQGAVEIECGTVQIGIKQLH
jgi:hypothetical protein